MKARIGRKEIEVRVSFSPQHQALQFETLNAQDIDGLLALVAETKVLRIPTQLQPLQVGAAVRDAVHQLGKYEIEY